MADAFEVSLDYMVGASEKRSISGTGQARQALCSPGTSIKKTISYFIFRKTIIRKPHGYVLAGLDRPIFVIN
jgi:hypothetical protein